MQIENINLETLIPYARNPRKNIEAVNAVAASIKEFGFLVPIVIDADKTIIAGHTRALAAQKLELKQVPCVKVQNLTPQQIKAFRIIDNKVSEKAEWDFELLQLELAELPEFEFEKFEIDFDDVDSFIDVNANSEDDEIPSEPEGEPQTQTGDIWLCGKHRVMCGDSINIKQVDILTQKEKLDVAFYSPPYNVGHNLGYKGKTSKYIESDNIENFDQFLIESTKIALSLCESVFVNLQFLANNKHDIIKFISNLNDNFKDVLFWKKSQVAPAMAPNVVNSQTEVILIFGKNNNRSIGNKKFRGNLSNHFETNSASGENKNADIHNATYPISLMSQILGHAYNAGSKCLDLFCGTGTSIIACNRMNMVCYGMEISPHYCDVICQRFYNETGIIPTEEQSGRSFIPILK